MSEIVFLCISLNVHDMEKCVRFSDENLVYISRFTYEYYIAFSFHSPWSDLPNTIW